MQSFQLFVRILLAFYAVQTRLYKLVNSKINL
jgi:hypothetical protein